MSRASPLRRFFRHLATDHGSVRRVFPDAALSSIEALIGDGEKKHRGQVRFAVEPALPLVRVLSGITPRERAIEVFGLLRIWDTEENCGVLIYLLLADRDVEIVADRGIHRRVGDEAWRAACRKMEAAFRAGHFAEGVERGLADVNALLAEHYPREGGGAANELPDRPVVL
ncbi:MAG TPA: TPM domain-containing protein [Casimicrobiaceae bacterium]|nr:TPM domain-containing protein [Casimicrobiaceae bacterium]